MASTPLIWIMLTTMAAIAYGADVGINYGRLGDNLPPPARVIDFLVQDLNNTIPAVRLFDPDTEALTKLATTNLRLTLGVRNEDIAQLAASPDAARGWLEANVFPYARTTATGPGLDFEYITVGNEVIPGPLAQFVLPAIRNLYQAQLQRNLTRLIKVSTVVNANVLGSSFPPSTGQFSEAAAPVMNDISNFLYSVGSPLLLNVYPYFAYISNPVDISLDYALFKAEKAVVQDGTFTYLNLFDAIVDAFVAAVVRAVSKEDVKLVVSESGWPSDGNPPHASMVNAQTYNFNLKKHIQTVGGTPRRPDLNLETFIFALFNEDLKPAGTEQNFGSFYPNLTEVYPLWRI